MQSEMSNGYCQTEVSFDHGLSETGPESTDFSSRAARRRAASHPIKMVLLTAKRVLQHPFSSSDSVEEQHIRPELPPLPNALDTKSNLLYSPSNFNASGTRNFTRRLLDAFPPTPKQHVEAKIWNGLGSETDSGNARLNPITDSDVPVRPPRSNHVDPDLVPQGALPVIVSSAKNIHSKTNTHRRRWTTQKSRHAYARGSTENEPFDVNLATQRTFIVMTKSESGSSQQDSSGSDSEDHALVDNIIKANSSGPFFSFTDESTGDGNQISCLESLDLLTVDNEDELDIEDLTTPTLKSCEKFESETPCQTYTTPTHNHQNFQHAEVRMTPRMIFEDFQRKFKEEDLLIKSRDLKMLDRKFSNASLKRDAQIPGSSNADAHQNTKNSEESTTGHSDVDADSSQDTSMDSTCSSSDSSMVDPADESFESFGDEQIFGAPLIAENLRIIRKSISRFPSPPVSNSPRSINKRTPSPKLPSEQQMKIKPMPRMLLEGDITRNGQMRNSSTSPLVLGNLLPTRRDSNKTSPVSPSPPRIHRANADFQRQPSPYRHVQAEGNDHYGPDHLESSTRMMKMFENYLENGPSNNSSARSSFSNKSIRKGRLQESPLRRLTDFRFPETPTKHISQSSRSNGKTSNQTLNVPINDGSPQRSSSLCLDTLRNKHSERVMNSLKSGIEPVIPQQTVSLVPDVCPSTAPRTNGRAVSNDKYSSPMSDSDEGPSESPRTPFGDLFNPPTQVDIERYAGPMLPDESFIQKISFVKDETVRLNFQSFSLDVLNRKESLTTFSRLFDTLDKGIPNDQSDLKSKSGEHNSLLHNSTWASIIQGNLDRSKIVAPLNNSNSKPITGRNLFEELNNVESLGKFQVKEQLMALVDTAKKISPHRSKQDFDSLNDIKDRTVAASISSSEAFRKFFSQTEQVETILEEKISHTIESGASSSKQQDFDKEYMEPILSPIRLYGKQQGILETGNWKTNNLNFQSMKSQYQTKTTENKSLNDNNPSGIENDHKRSSSSSSSRSQQEKNQHWSIISNVTRHRSMTHNTEATQVDDKHLDGNKINNSLEDEEREKEESLIVYQIQQEDDNQIINFEINRLKKIFHNKALKLSKSRSKLLSSKQSIK